MIGPVFPVLLIALPGFYAATTTKLYLNYPVAFNIIFGLVGTKVTNKLIVSAVVIFFELIVLVFLAWQSFFSK